MKTENTGFISRYFSSEVGVEARCCFCWLMIAHKEKKRKEKKRKEKKRKEKKRKEKKRKEKKRKEKKNKQNNK